MKTKNNLDFLSDYSTLVNTEINQLLSSRQDYLMYDMMRYFFGFCDENFRKTNFYGGKKLRPGICLLIADFYGIKNECIPIASAIEIFHNFTLIHDDIEDRDELRRGRPTVWKLWGINHGINTGDAQLVLSNIELSKIDSEPIKNVKKIKNLFNECFLGIIEGQFLDFALEEKQLSDIQVNFDSYIKMITRKCALLYGLSAKSVGYAAGKPDTESDYLWQFGLNFGIAFQIFDDMMSIWGTEEKTGKSELGDIIERKKSLPIILYYDNCSDLEKSNLEKLYSSDKEISYNEANSIKQLLNDNKIYSLVWEKMNFYVKLSNEAIESLSVKNEDKEILRRFNDFLLSEAERIKC